MMTDPIADMLTRLRNAARVSKSEIVLPFSRLKFTILKILSKEGFVGAVERVPAPAGVGEDIRVVLTYLGGKRNVINSITRISKPGRRLYIGYRDLIKGSAARRGCSIISTPKGVMTSAEARKLKLGGEIICEVY